MRRVKCYKCIWPCCDCKWATKQHEHVCPLTSIIKDQPAKSKITWNQVCVLARHKIWWFSFVSNTHCACMLLWKRFAIFPRNLSCQGSYFWWKLVDLLAMDQSWHTFSSCRSISCTRLETLRALVLQFSPVLQHGPARRLNVLVRCILSNYSIFHDTWNNAGLWECYQCQPTGDNGYMYCSLFRS